MKKSSINSKVDVSVITVNYNTGKLLQKCLDSIIKSTNNLKDPKTEIIIIDNASTDNSADVKGQFKLIKNDSNPGFSKANNQGIKKAKGDYILLLNPDTEVKGDAIKKLHEYAKEKPDAGVIVPKLLNTNGTTQDSLMPLPTIFRAFKEFWLGEKVYSRYVPAYKEPTQVEGAIMAAFLITPLCLQKVGLLNERYFMYFEDLDYCRAVQKAGLKIYYLPNAQVVHHQGVSGKNVATSENQWKRLIPGSKIYHGLFTHYILFIILWTAGKFKMK